MQETVTNTNERKSLFSAFLEVLEARDKQAQADRELQEEKYQRRTQRIYDFHERQQREAVELRRCLDYVSQHAHVLESVVRGAAAEGAPLAAALLRQAAALQRCMAQCVANAARIRQLLSAAHRPQMDAMLAKMVSAPLPAHCRRAALIPSTHINLSALLSTRHRSATLNR
ncbi:jg14637 [Pararge aegeria aegeria]|uniref:Jg14637 protein n=1 Tax=Pararge aegeria aegeria TaxID=348720 RepID=A0A8S4RYB9_9NEOP|nr:jg14637 [Pararge aegeria aegeria]